MSDGRGIDEPDARDGGDEHLGWRISALLDGELGVTEEILAREHLERCERCEQEFVEVMTARTFVRQLGEVEPPQGFLDKLASGDRSRLGPRAGLVALVGLAAAWILFLAIGVNVTLPDVSPPVDEFAAQHVALAAEDRSALPERSDGFERIAQADLDDLDAPYVAPASLGDGGAPPLARLAGYDAEGALQILYSDGETDVSVFQQEGSLDWGALPETGERRQVDRSEAWVGTVHAAGGGTEPAVVVVDKGNVVYTVVTDASLDAALTVAGELPDPPAYSFGQRAQRNLEELARRIGLGAARSEPG